MRFDRSAASWAAKSNLSETFQVRSRLNNCRPGLDKPVGWRLTFQPMSLRPAFPTSTNRRSGEAFTLLEILVVLRDHGLLVSLAVTNVGNLFGGAQKDIAKMFVSQSMQAPLAAYKIHLGDYPTTAQGLQALITPPGIRPNAGAGRISRRASFQPTRGANPTNTAILA